MVCFIIKMSYSKKASFFSFFRLRKNREYYEAWIEKVDIENDLTDEIVYRDWDQSIACKQAILLWDKKFPDCLQSEKSAKR